MVSCAAGWLQERPKTPPEPFLEVLGAEMDPKCFCFWKLCFLRRVFWVYFSVVFFLSVLFSRSVVILVFCVALSLCCPLRPSVSVAFFSYCFFTSCFHVVFLRSAYLHACFSFALQSFALSVPVLTQV